MSFPSAILQHGALTWRVEGTLFPLTVLLAIAMLPLSKGTIFRQSRIQVAIHKIFDCRSLFPSATVGVISKNTQLKGFNFLLAMERELPRGATARRTKTPAAHRKMRYPHVAKLSDPFPSGHSIRDYPHHGSQREQAQCQIVVQVISYHGPSGTVQCAP